MKRCPQCYQPYPDSERFCELDGQPLLADVAARSIGKVVESQTVPAASSQKSDAPMMVIVGVLVGVLLTSVVYVGYAILTAEPPADDSRTSVSKIENSDTRLPTRPRSEVRESSPTPEEESSPTPEVEEEPEATPSTEATLAARLNQGPVSTGERKQSASERAGDKTIIEMNDGTSIEVDAAWQDSQGLWYRRGGLVSFVESKRIKGIQAARQEPKPESLSSPNP